MIILLIMVDVRHVSTLQISTCTKINIKIDTYI